MQNLIIAELTPANARLDTRTRFRNEIQMRTHRMLIGSAPFPPPAKKKKKMFTRVLRDPEMSAFLTALNSSHRHLLFKPCCNDSIFASPSPPPPHPPLRTVNSSSVHSGSNACTQLGEHVLPKQKGPVGDIQEPDKEAVERREDAHVSPHVNLGPSRLKMVDVKAVLTTRLKVSKTWVRQENNRVVCKPLSMSQ